MEKYNKNLNLKDLSLEPELIKLADDFLLSESEKLGGEFLESSLWLKVLGSENIEAKRFMVLDEHKNILALFLIILKKIKPFGFYFYSPRGPIIKGDLSLEDKILVWQFLNKEISRGGFFNSREESFNKIKPLFFRFEPEKNWPQEELGNCPTSFSRKTSVCLKKTTDLQPAKTLMLSLLKSEADILQEMHQKTRYNLRLAEKKGVKIFESENREEDFLEFWRLMKLTGKRDVFGIHGENHYRNLLKDDFKENIKLFFAEYKGQKIAAAICLFFDKRVTYLHGASDDSFRNLMAPHLLQFQIIKKAKEENYLVYDFFGIDEKKWPGVTRFKKGFGGFEYEYAGTFDFIYHPFIYFLYNLLRKSRRFLRKIIK